MSHPWLHVVTSDEVIAGADFLKRALEVISVLGPAGIFHLRTRRLATRAYVVLAQRLLDQSSSTGAVLIINGRVDVALATGADGVQLGHGALNAPQVRSIAPELKIGVSVHSISQAKRASSADWILFGHVFESSTHPGQLGRGIAELNSVVRASGIPTVALGGITPELVPEILRTGASGVAVLSGIWGEHDPKREVLRYLSKHDYSSIG